MQEFRYAVRQLIRTPGFSVIAILTLALGIGANTAVYAAVEAVVFRPLRAARLDGLFTIRFHDHVRRTHAPLTDAQMRRLEQDPPDALAHVGAVQPMEPVTMQSLHRAERVIAETVTAGYLPAFGHSPQAGRLFTSADDAPGAAPVAVIGDRVWREWFDDDRDPIGRAILRVDGVPFTVIGVAPRGFTSVFSVSRGNVDLWMTAAGARRIIHQRGGDLPRFWQVFVRPAPGVTPAQAEAAIHAVFTTGPDAPAPQSIAVRLQTAGGMLSSLANVGLALVGLAALVLLAACANLANMLFARGTERAGEVAVRLSLGASRLQIFRLFLAETAIIAALASVLGLLIALSATAALSALFPSFRTRTFRVFIDLTPDYRVFVYAVAVGVLATMAVGMTTAWRASRILPLRHIGASGVASGSTRRGRRTRHWMVALQVTAAVLLLMGAGLYLTAARMELNKHVAFDTTPLATALIDVRLHGYHDARGRVFFDQLLRDLRTVPGIESAALTDGFPGGSYVPARPVLITAIKEAANEAGQTRELAGAHRRINAGLAGVSSGFLDTIQLALTRGRDIMPTDQDGTPLVVVISESAAAQLWPAQDALGKRLMFGNEHRWRTVVGVSADPVLAAGESPLVSPANLVLMPAAQWYRPEMLVVVRSRMPAAQLESIQSAVRAIDADVAASDVATADRSIMSWVAPLHAATTIMGSLGALALAIAMFGVYGAITYAVSQRTRELGLRMALGARPRQVIELVMTEARYIILLGLLAGVFVAAVGERYLQSQRFGFMPNEIGTWAAVLIIVLAIGMLAAFIPAHRASRIDPNIALREL